MSASQQSAEGEGTPSGDPPAAPCASAESVEDAASAPEGASVSDERRRAKRGGGGRGARRGGAAASKSARAHESEEASELHRAVRAGDKAEVERILSDASRAFLVHAIDSLRRWVARPQLSLPFSRFKVCFIEEVKPERVSVCLFVCSFLQGASSPRSVRG